MALARCETCGHPKGKTKTYTHRHDPLSDPLSGVICGTKECTNPARIWLTDPEETRYLAGERIFGFDTATVKVKLS